MDGQIHDIKIRYNTMCNDDLHYWRAVIDGTESLYSEIEINVQVKTTKDFIEGVGIKFHISCKGKTRVEGSKLIVD